MIVTPLAISEVILLEPKAFADDRGLFFESFNTREFAQVVGHEVGFVQDNHSISKRGVVRGLHYQLPPTPQGKLVRVVRGAIFDVAVDIRKHSRSFGRWVGETLTADNRRQLWIPAGFAHGFMALSDGTEVLYKATDFYNPKAESAIRWDDPALGIAWPDAGSPIVSGKDAGASLFEDAKLFD